MSFHFQTHRKQDILSLHAASLPKNFISKKGVNSLSSLRNEGLDACDLFKILVSERRKLNFRNKMLYYIRKCNSSERKITKKQAGVRIFEENKIGIIC